MEELLEALEINSINQDIIEELKKNKEEL